MELTNSQKNKLMQKMEKFNEELNKFKGKINEKVTFGIWSEFNEYIRVYYNDRLYFEIQKKINKF